ncbi:MAG: hypothetical protein QOI10_2113 [Solirubrobacterales bacterium]|jgi:sporulation protein YlmC with PRC-barrel domain|nr:hypothetical protein [Solirubrobacterales bacterium]
MAERGQELDLAYRLLDLDLVDSEGIRCGKVDDLALEGDPGRPTYVSAILSGTGAMPPRFPQRLQRLAARVFRGKVREVPWEEVEDFDATVVLHSPAAQLGLGDGDRDLTRLVGGGGEDG